MSSEQTSPISQNPLVVALEQDGAFGRAGVFDDGIQAQHAVKANAHQNTDRITAMGGISRRQRQQPAGAERQADP